MKELVADTTDGKPGRDGAAVLGKVIHDLVGRHVQLFEDLLLDLNFDASSR